MDFFNKSIVVFLLLLFGFEGYSQTIHSGEIIFNRRTNLEKRFEGNERMSSNKRFKKMLEKPSNDKFVLYFTDSECLFLPILPPVDAGDREWATMKNTTYQNLDTETIKKAYSFMGTELFVKDSLRKRKWIITGNAREIAGYEAKQAMWVANDTTRIYAWYAEQIIPSVGPESFNGLPGAILGLAIEDGGVVYFAEEVKPLSKPNFTEEYPKNKKEKTYSREELLKLVQTMMTGRDFVTNRMMYDVYIW